MQKTYTKLLKELTSIAPRRGDGEQKACETIKRHLEQNKIAYTAQTFTTKIPVTKKVQLYTDGEKIPCIASTFVSGKIDKKSPILNSIDAKSDGPAIVFHPVSKGICMQAYKNFPCISVNRDSVAKLIMAKEIIGEVEVDSQGFKSANIIVGNLVNPSKIVFAHYDSIIGAGAIDNAGSVEVVYQVLSENKDLLDKHLFVFAGSEEESISSHFGLYGFEIFGQKYGALLKGAKQIIVLDGVGVGTPSFTSDHIDWVFEVSNMPDLAKKTVWMLNDQSLVMQYYHSDLDTLDKLDPRFLNEAKALLLERLR